MNKVLDIQVRAIDMKLVAENRSLELCARMNYETENLDFIDAMEENAVLFDLGACEGRFSMYAGLKGIRTFSFEPEAMNFDALSRNIDANNLEHIVSAFNVGLSDKESSGIMSIGQPWAGGHQKIVQHNAVRTDVSAFEAKETQEISLTSLDQFMASNPDIPNPNYLKIDIDGSELPFIKGAKEALIQPNLKGILIELQENDKASIEVFDALVQLGFVLENKFPIPNEPFLFNYLLRRQ